MKDFKRVPKNKWVRLIRKKWFLPAVYVTISGLILSAVVWYQAMGNPWMNSADMRDEIEQMDPHMASDFNEEAQSVLQQQETIQMPIDKEMEAEIVTRFYDYDAAEEEQEKGLMLYNNRYYQSTGIDIVESTGESFDVITSLSGTVTEVKEDPLLGNVVTILHGDTITTHYASLGEVEVDAGADVKQGDKIGTAGKNVFNESSGTHVHFELHKDGIEVNPEQFFNEQVSALEKFDIEVTDMDESEEENQADMPTPDQDKPTPEQDSQTPEKDDEVPNQDEKTPEEEERQEGRKGTNEDVSFSMTT